MSILSLLQNLICRVGVLEGTEEQAAGLLDFRFKLINAAVNMPVCMLVAR